jgi:hypothetical protein
VEDCCLAVYCEVGSIPKGLLQGQGRIHFYLGLFSFLLFLGEGKGTGLFKFIASFKLQKIFTLLHSSPILSIWTQ